MVGEDRKGDVGVLLVTGSRHYHPFFLKGDLLTETEGSSVETYGSS